MSSIAIVAGGTLSETLLSDIRSHDIIIGVDRGAWWLITYKIIPHFSIGDFDSVSPEEREIINQISPNVVQYEAEKNETDLELGIEFAVKLDPTSINVYGCVGSRFDHSLAGILLLTRFKQNITIHDQDNEISVIHREKTIEKKDIFSYCSFISLTNTAVITLQGFKYPLDHGMLQRSKTLGISNEIVEPKANITVYKGIVLCIQSRG